MSSLKKIIVCADDFALNAGVSAAILELLSKGAISATSCMSTSPLWPEWGQYLKPLKSQVDLGLHLDLSEFLPLSVDRPLGLKKPQSIGKIILKSYGHRFSLNALIAEIHLQLEQFKTVLGFTPDFIDGHQHVHQFPQIRDALITVYTNYFKNNESPPVLRLVNGQPFFRPLKDSLGKLLIHGLGRNALKRRLDKAKIAYYPDFKGIYVFKGNPLIAELWPYFLQDIKPGGLVMCHPGHLSDPKTDPIASIRENEYCFLNSDRWPALCQEKSIQLCRYKETL